MQPKFAELAEEDGNGKSSNLLHFEKIWYHISIWNLQKIRYFEYKVYTEHFCIHSIYWVRKVHVIYLKEIENISIPKYLIITVQDL